MKRAKKPKYITPHMIFRFNSIKNAKLLRERAVGFEEIIEAIEKEGILGLESHPNSEKYPDQSILYVRLQNEAGERFI
jgi:hypothetical protein